MPTYHPEDHPKNHLGQWTEKPALKPNRAAIEGVREALEATLLNEPLCEGDVVARYQGMGGGSEELGGVEVVAYYSEGNNQVVESYDLRFNGTIINSDPFPELPSRSTAQRTLQNWVVEQESEYDDYWDDSMDGDHASALASVGWGTDEDYGSYGDDDFGDYGDEW